MTHTSNEKHIPSTAKYVLGINWEQNSSASLFCDGHLLGCISEERLSRTKNDERYPKRAIEHLLREYKVTAAEISAVCFVSTSWAPGYILTRHYTTYTIEDYILEQHKIWYPRIFEGDLCKSQLDVFPEKVDLNQFPGAEFWQQVMEAQTGKSAHVSDVSQVEFGQKLRASVVDAHLKIDANKVHFLDHSLSHACYAYYATCQDSKPRLVLTLDAFGDFINYSARVICKRTSDKGVGYYDEKLLSQGGNFIIGRLYRYITLILGLKPNEHEYKVMGLAPYCKPRYYEKLLNKFRKLQGVTGLSFVDKEKPKDLYFSIKEMLDGERFDSIAGALQAYTEELIVGWVKNCVNESGVGDICIAGGVAMNVKANMLISGIDGVTSISVPPSPDDSSQAMGAVYAYYHHLNRERQQITPKPLSSPYLGQSPRLDIEKLTFAINNCSDSNRKYIVIDQSVVSTAVQLLSSGKVLGRIAGREEFGARALGNRSILADPRDPTIKKIINEKIKDRDFWMPFACSVASEYASNYLKLYSPLECYRYMTLCCDSLFEGNLNELAAAVHPYDETCRPHIVFKGENPSYHELICAFGEATGTYALLNTSLNLHGSPIASSFEDALHVFFHSELDGLLTDSFIILKIEN
jgi:carbamoyltransferase